MNAFGWCALAAMFVATITMGVLSSKCLTAALEAHKSEREAEEENEQLRAALAKEQREHRLLLARREAKREQTKKAPQGTGMSGAGLELVDAHAPVVIAEEPATLILSSNTLTRTGGGND